MGSRKTNTHGTSSNANPPRGSSTTRSKQVPMMTRWLQQDITDEPFYSVRTVDQAGGHQSAANGQYTTGGQGQGHSSAGYSWSTAATQGSSRHT